MNNRPITGTESRTATDSEFTTSATRAMEKHHSSLEKLAELDAALQELAELKAAKLEPQGTYACPVCGEGTPHGHTDGQFLTWLEAQASRFGVLDLWKIRMRTPEHRAQFEEWARRRSAGFPRPWSLVWIDGGYGGYQSITTNIVWGCWQEATAVSKKDRDAARDALTTLQDRITTLNDAWLEELEDLKNDHDEWATPRASLLRRCRADLKTALLAAAEGAQPS